MTRSIRVFAVAASFVVGLTSVSSAQLPDPLPEHKIVQMDVGTWNATVKMFMGADGRADENADPIVSEGVEVNKKLGEFWVVSDFKGDFGGLPFTGHGISGYDPKIKKFVGTWIDSMTMSPMTMQGTYDPKAKVLTTMSTGVGPDGSEVKGKTTVHYVDENTRKMVMYELRGDQEVKSMAIDYKRAAGN